MCIEQDNGLNAEFQFGRFVDAFAFMTNVAIIAEKMDHRLARKIDKLFI